MLLDSVLDTYSVPDTGFTAMLNSTVPTCGKATFSVSLLASTANTSLSGRVNSTPVFQLRPSSSSQRFLSRLYLTKRPVLGAGLPSALVSGPRRPPGMILVLTRQGVLTLKPSQTSSSLMEDVSLPDLKAAT